MFPMMLSSLPIAFRSFWKCDVGGLHPDRFELDSVLVAIVFHPLQCIQIPAAAFRTILGLNGEVFDSVAQVVLQILARRDSRSRDAVVVATHMHEGIFPGGARSLR